MSTMREKFEEDVARNFRVSENMFDKDNYGNYVAEYINEHWQTWQTAWEAAIENTTHFG